MLARQRLSLARCFSFLALTNERYGPGLGKDILLEKCPDTDKDNMSRPLRETIWPGQVVLLLVPGHHGAGSQQPWTVGPGLATSVWARPSANSHGAEDNIKSPAPWNTSWAPVSHVGAQGVPRLLLENLVLSPATVVQVYASEAHVWPLY